MKRGLGYLGCLGYLGRSSAQPLRARGFALAMGAVAAFGCIKVQAQFALAVSPPRLELSSKAGERVREVLELSHSDLRQGDYKFKTADWTLKPDGSVDFSDDLAPGSCRPWVALERRELSLSSERPYRYRFEITPPADASPVECRFAILIEGKEQALAPGMPIAATARLGVIVYVAIGDVQPMLNIAGVIVKKINGQDLPVLRVHNSGSAHGRLAGFLSGTDAGGNRLEFQPATTPVMPGETRDIVLTATHPSDVDTAVAVRFPVTVTGTLEWGKTGVFKLNERFAP